MKKTILPMLAIVLIAAVGCSKDKGDDSSEKGASKGTTTSTAKGSTGGSPVAEMAFAAPAVVVGTPEIGKPVPEIEGTDTDGKPFKLSDYRGKVVMLDFWGDW